MSFKKKIRLDTPSNFNIDLFALDQVNINAEKNILGPLSTTNCSNEILLK